MGKKCLINLCCVGVGLGFWWGFQKEVQIKNIINAENGLLVRKWPTRSKTAYQAENGLLCTAVENILIPILKWLCEPFLALRADFRLRAPNSPREQKMMSIMQT